MTDSPTIKDIAARAGVSISTVHYALRRTRPISDATRRRVLTAIEELDYHPHAGAATLPSGRTGRLAVVIGDIEPAFANTYFSDFIRGLAAGAEAEDHNVVLYTAYGKRARGGWRPAHVLRRREADGLLLLGTQISDDHLDELADAKLPCVLLNRERAGLPSVTSDRAQGVRVATQHLINTGYGQIGLLLAAYPGGGPPSDRPELAGFRDVLSQSGRDALAAPVKFASVDEPVEAPLLGLLGALGVHPRSASRATEPVAREDVRVQGKRPGLVTFSYTLGPQAVQTIAATNIRVPEELGLVVGDDDLDGREALLAPAPAVVASKFEMAQAAVRLLLRLVRREEVPEPELCTRYPMTLKVPFTTAGAREL